MSKFLNLCDKIQNLLNEQDDQMETPVDQTQMDQPLQTQNAPEQPQMDQAQPQEEEQSELPIISNDKIAQLANAMKIFYSKQDSKIEDDDIKQILSLNPRNSKESEDIVKIIDTLTNIFNPVSIKTQPEEVKPSTTE
jgi:hypothetical protein